jgi:hypothetical protein
VEGLPEVITSAGRKALAKTQRSKVFKEVVCAPTAWPELFFEIVYNTGDAVLDQHLSKVD